MGFRSVYRVLQDVFPQVDPRALRAVAIEHSKDADAAVEVVLVEVIPYLSQKPKPMVSSNESGTSINTSEVVVVDTNDIAARSDDVIPEDLSCLNETVDATFYEANVVNKEEHSDNYNTTNDELVSTEKGEARVDVSIKELSGVEVTACGRENEADSNHHQSSVMENSQVEYSPSTVELPNVPENTPQSLNHLSADLEKLEQSGTFNEDMMAPTQVVDLEDDSTMNDDVINRSGQVCSIDFLEEIIEDARSNKKTLLLAMEAVISLMKEVELKEKAAEKAKEEAAQGGLDILRKVEELKQQLRLAKEANDMHAGEVYGEKAILATEMRELQTRLFGLSDKRDKSLAILDEMRQTLELRLSAAEKERKAAEQEKVEREESAQNLLNNQNGIMEKVVQESKILKQAAEENSKLRDFLIDRGHVVDILQGEINVKCQDVKLLKERFDDRVPLSKFLSASQTSSITSILASSSSSMKSNEAADEVVKVTESSENHKEKSDSQHISSEDERTNDDVNRLFDGGEKRGRVVSADDGWELFRNEDKESGVAAAGGAIAGDDGWELFRSEKASGDYSKMLSEDGWELFDNREYYK